MEDVGGAVATVAPGGAVEVSAEALLDAIKEIKVQNPEFGIKRVWTTLKEKGMQVQHTHKHTLSTHKYTHTLNTHKTYVHVCIYAIHILPMNVCAGVFYLFRARPLSVHCLCTVNIPRSTSGRLLYSYFRVLRHKNSIDDVEGRKWPGVREPCQEVHAGGWAHGEQQWQRRGRRGSSNRGWRGRGPEEEERQQEAKGQGARQSRL